MSNLNSGSGYSFPTPYKWRVCTGLDVTSHTGKISFLLGGDSFINFPQEVERDQWGVELYRSLISGRFIIYGSVNPSTIMWFKTESNVNMVCVKSLSVLDWQEQLLLTISAEKYSDASNREKLSLMNKKKTTKEILDNTTVDLLHNKVSVKCLFEEDKLANLGENLFGVTKRVTTLQNKVYSRADTGIK